jgi:hypothetical protein
MRQGQREKKFISIKSELLCTKNASFRITYKKLQVFFYRYHPDISFIILEKEIKEKEATLCGNRKK